MSDPRPLSEGPPVTAHRMRGLGVFILGGVALFLMMAQEGHIPFATLWGVAALLACSLGLCFGLGMVSPAGPDVTSLSETWLGPRPGERPLIAPLRVLPAALLLIAVVAGVAPDGLPWAIVASLLALAPAALRRPSLLVFVVASGLLLPVLGAFGLWDPWETHYGEVAREILARNDWISLWWAQDRWFWSKPILIFWAEALTWNATGVPFTSDSHFQHAEWILRLPVFALAMLAVLAVHRLVSLRVGTRAGVLSSLVLAATPYFGFLSHQAITDMYFVASMTVAMMLLLSAIGTDPARQVGSVRVFGWALDARHVVLTLLVCLVLPQVLYLASRNVAMVDGFRFAWHFDDFPYGSAGNRDVPGNFGYRLQRPHYRALAVQPMAQALYWTVGFVVLLLGVRRQRSAQALSMTGFYVFCALAFMGKGIPGFALPGLVALLYLVASGRWSMLLSGRLRIAHGVLVIAVIAMPWFVAMFVRHGPAFTDRLLIHDHINRLTKGVHGDKGTVQYFINQLGYGLFPWVVLLPACLGGWLGRRSDPETPPGDAGSVAATDQVLTFAGLWFAAAFTLFSAMTTKFHHYIFPAVPAAAMLLGIGLSRMLQPLSLTGFRPRLGLVLAVLAPVALVVGAGSLFGDPRGVVPATVGPEQQASWVAAHPYPLALSLGLLGLGLGLLLAAHRLQRPSMGAVQPLPAMSAGLIAGAIVGAFAGRDLSWSTQTRPVGNELLAHLFIYNYDRPWPGELDYRAILSGFAIVAVALALLSAWTRMRALGAQALLGLGLAFSVFCLDVYMLDATRHWTQAHLVERYYDLRQGPDEPLIAWQMNWKGENFYTGNRVHVFQALDNKAINQWIDKHAGTHAYFLLEHKRLARFRRLLGKRPVRELTTLRDCNKFILVDATL